MAYTISNEERVKQLIEVYTDGAASGNPGPSGVGIIIKADNKFDEFSYSLGNLSNHEAEFVAVIKALEICKKRYPDEILSFRTDSKVVVDTIEKNFTKNKSFLPLLERIQALTNDFPLFFIKWIPEKQNYNADRLARLEIYRNKKNNNKGE